jgi:single-strand DNA-binding protein
MSDNVTFSGAIVKDPVLKFLDSGKAVTNFTIRVVTGKKSDNQDYPPSMFLDVAVWDALAENVAESLHDKDRVIVVGKLVADSWEDKDTGKKVTKVKVNAFEVGADLAYACVTVEQNDRTGRKPRKTNDPGF